jgi:hypothetical protein
VSAQHTCAVSRGYCEGCRESGERETLARVVALVDREIRERDGLHQNEAVQALCGLREELTSGAWKEDGDG